MVNIRGASRVAERLQSYSSRPNSKSYDLRKLGHFKKTTELLRTSGKVLSPPPKKQIFTVVLQNCQKSAVKNFIEKIMLINFVDLTTIFC